MHNTNYADARANSVTHDKDQSDGTVADSMMLRTSE